MQKTDSLWFPETEYKNALMDINPILATRMMVFNSKNRPLKEAKVQRIADKMAAGRWTFTHQGLAFGSDGKLLDGQHRLGGVIKSGVTTKFQVTFGLDPVVFKDIDTSGGIKDSRSAADLVAIMKPDAVNRNDLCACARSMLMGHTEGREIDPATTAEFAIWYYDLISAIWQAMRPLPSWVRLSPLRAAFANAARGVDEWPGGHGCRNIETILAAAERYGQMAWNGRNDALRTLYERIIRSKDKIEKARSTAVYAMAVGALRAELQGKTRVNAPLNKVDWGEEGDYGQRPRNAKPQGGPDFSLLMPNINTEQSAHAR